MIQALPIIIQHKKQKQKRTRSFIVAWLSITARSPVVQSDKGYICKVTGLLDLC
jgi:hypothetical protein